VNKSMCLAHTARQANRAGFK